MRIARLSSELSWREETTVGFVPTMGAFHEGHLSLMRAAKSECGFAVVSLFVNPTQFGPNDDFARYPRNEERDFAMARDAGVDVLFAPSLAEVYPRKTTTVHVTELSELWEGAHRPGHFDGVTTVVTKLFNMVRPDVAYFGLKDFQQCAVVRRMVEDLDFAIRLRFLETVRESNGLAMSSRNAYLDVDARKRAAKLFGVLSETAARLRERDLSARTVSELLGEALATLQRDGFVADYFALVDGTSLQPLPTPRRGARLIAAARLDGVRLIDNCAVFDEELPAH